MNASTALSGKSQRRCIFFDRDGVLNQATVRDGKAYSPRCFADFVLDPAASAVVHAVKELGYLAIVVTNQPDISRQLMPEKELDRMHELLAAETAVDEIRYCPHDDAAGCHCRKPLPGMLVDAAADWQLSLADCFLIGDSWKDMDASRAAGVPSILLDRPYNQAAKADFHLDTLANLPHFLRNQKA